MPRITWWTSTIVRCLQRLLAIVLVMLTGCPSTPAPPESASLEPAENELLPLRVGIVGDNQIASVIEREWKAQAQQAVTVTQVSPDEWASIVNDADVILFPTAMLGTLVVERALMPWPLPTSPNEADYVESASADYGWPDLLPWLRRQELRWGPQIYGVSFGSPQLVLLYRSDLFSKWGLQPPRTWAEYQDTVQQIESRIAAAEPTDMVPRFATAEPLAGDWAATMLCARAASYVKHADQYSAYLQFATMQPLIATPPFLRALEELKTSAASMPDNGLRLTPADSMKALLRGQVAMAVAWPSAAREPEETPVGPASFGMAVLPGSDEFFRFSSNEWQRDATGQLRQVPLLGISGLMGAVARRSRSTDQATSFLMWLTHPDQATRVATRSRHTAPFRQSQLNRLQVWSEPQLASISSQYADVVKTIQQSPIALQHLRIPGREQYLKVLDQAVRSAIRGESTIEEALQAAAIQWRDITQSLDKRQQRNAYHASLGLALE